MGARVMPQQVQIDPSTGERKPPISIDPVTGERMGVTPHGIDPNKLSQSLIRSQMSGSSPAFTYDNHDLINQEFKQQGMDVPDTPTGIANDFVVGLHGSTIGLATRHKLPEHLNDPSMFDNFVSDVGTLIGDLPVYAAGLIAGGVAGSEVPVVGTAAGASIGAF